jgi:hypothetical protein
MSVSRFRVQALTLVALVGAVGACTRGHDDDDDLSLRGIRGPISEFPAAGLDAAVTVPDQGGGTIGASDGSGSGGYQPSGPGDFGGGDAGVTTPPFSAQDAGTGTAGDAGDSSSGDAGPDADAGDAGGDADAAPPCWLLCP